MNRTRWVQLIFVVLAVAALAVGAMLSTRLDYMHSAQNEDGASPEVTQAHPEIAVLTTAFGGFRAPLVAYLWIRAEKSKQDGDTKDAVQLADMICQLLPRFPGVWDYQAWNLAYNISVTAYTPEERWLWVMNGMKLLRDRGIALNPRSLELYKALGMLFFHKIAGETDEMHGVYKFRWADEMQSLLGAPPLGRTEDVIAAFRKIANAPLDSDLRRQGKEAIQSDQLAVLLSDPAVKDYAESILKVFSEDQGDVQMPSFLAGDLLALYNRYSTDYAASIARREPPDLNDDRAKRLSDLVNDASRAGARDKLLSFVRAQKLWNVYKMDPHWMLAIMERFNIPLDWRLPQAHGLYWTSYGLHMARRVDPSQVDSINTDRILSFCFRHMMSYGRLTYKPLARGMAMDFTGDLRFIEPLQQEQLRIIDQYCRASGKSFKDNIFRDGHINWLVTAVQMLYAGGRREQAGKYLRWIKDNYEPTGESWKLDLDAFVRYELAKETSSTKEFAVNQLTAAVQFSYESLIKGDVQAYQESLAYARYVHETYTRSAPRRSPLPQLEDYQINIVYLLLVRPEILGVPLDLADRVTLYTRVRDSQGGDEMLCRIYDGIAPILQEVCTQAGKSFTSAFPPPAGLDAYRQRIRQEMSE